MSPFCIPSLVRFFVKIIGNTVRDWQKTTDISLLVHDQSAALCK